MSAPYPTHRRIKDMLATERPQERLEALGVESLSDRELLAMILRSGTPGVDVVSMCGEMLHEAGSLRNLLRWSAEDFRKIRGIGRVKALQLIATMHFAKRILADEETQETIYDSAAMVARHFRPLVAGAEVESFWILCLDRKNRLIKRVEITKGTATSCLAHPREVFRPAIKVNATAIIAVHNHPSGDPAPSRADIQITRQLRESAKVICIELTDHVIIGERQRDPQGLGFYSFNDAGLV
ncbi:MAG: JAB domain-containing protein [Puniceicoccaceae bacterium]|nr:MAG: JAB domain-containing protein [Puniceicoccaceae bacterium]